MISVEPGVVGYNKGDGGVEIQTVLVSRDHYCSGNKRATSLEKH